jgi:hypothetical protein
MHRSQTFKPKEASNQYKRATTVTASPKYSKVKSNPPVSPATAEALFSEFVTEYSKFAEFKPYDTYIFDMEQEYSKFRRVLKAGTPHSHLPEIQLTIEGFNKSIVARGINSKDLLLKSLKSTHGLILNILQYLKSAPPTQQDNLTHLIGWLKDFQFPEFPPYQDPDLENYYFKLDNLIEEISDFEERSAELTETIQSKATAIENMEAQLQEILEGKDDRLSEINQKLNDERFNRDGEVNEARMGLERVRQEYKNSLRVIGKEKERAVREGEREIEAAVKERDQIIEVKCSRLEEVRNEAEKSRRELVMFGGDDGSDVAQKRLNLDPEVETIEDELERENLAKVKALKMVGAALLKAKESKRIAVTEVEENIEKISDERDFILAERNDFLKKIQNHKETLAQETIDAKIRLETQLQASATNREKLKKTGAKEQTSYQQLLRLKTNKTTEEEVLQKKLEADRQKTLKIMAQFVASAAKHYSITRKESLSSDAQKPNGLFSDEPKKPLLGGDHESEDSFLTEGSRDLELSEDFITTEDIWVDIRKSKEKFCEVIEHNRAIIDQRDSKIKELEKDLQDLLRAKDQYNNLIYSPAPDEKNSPSPVRVPENLVAKYNECESPMLKGWKQERADLVAAIDSMEDRNFELTELQKDLQERLEENGEYLEEARSNLQDSKRTTAEFGQEVVKLNTLIHIKNQEIKKLLPNQDSH